MPKLPILKPREVVSILGRLGFAEVRQRGSHKQSATQTAAVRPFLFTSGEYLSPNLLRKIIEDIRLPPEEFLKLL